MFKVFRYLPIALLAGTLTATTACASGYYGRGYGQGPYAYGADVQRIAFDNGYKEGLEHGEKDARRNRPYSLERNDDFRDADEGYRRSFGDREFYRQTFRDGFARGYREAYDRWSRGRYDDRDHDRDRW